MERDGQMEKHYGAGLAEFGMDETWRGRGRGAKGDSQASSLSTWMDGMLFTDIKNIAEN